LKYKANKKKMAGRIEIQNYGDKVVFKNGEAEEVTVQLKAVPATDEPIEATGVVHVEDFDKGGPAVAFVGTECGVFAIDTNTGAQKAQLLGSKRMVRCFQVIKKTLYVGVKDKTSPTSENFGLWTIDTEKIEAHPIEKVGDWEIVAMTLNSTESQMAATYCDNVNGNYFFEVHLLGISPDGRELTHQTRIGGDGWGEVVFKEDDKCVIIDNTEFPIPAQYLVEKKTLGGKRKLEGDEKVDGAKNDEKKRKTT
jgi:hypothetical protein